MMTRSPGSEVCGLPPLVLKPRPRANPETCLTQSLCLPRVDDGYASRRERSSVSRRDGESVCPRDRGDLAVSKRDRVPSSPRAADEPRVNRGGLLVEGQDARAEESHDEFRQSLVEPASTFAGRQELDADQQLRKAGRREVQRVGNLAIEPRRHRGIALRLHRLRHDVGIEYDHSKVAGSIGDLSLAVSRSKPPNRSPNAASSDPILTRVA